ncbi:hypothetical protein [Cellulomonas sp. Y8]|uniref:hypothetical protein n=1 Tax=Cellulomonas sp. Y8 TaxID=2591145 RepID=UPI0011CB4DCB|nr:hypothetical protein [Cellulomonas sp. Y8]
MVFLGVVAVVLMVGSAVSAASALRAWPRASASLLGQLRGARLGLRAVVLASIAVALLGVAFLEPGSPVIRGASVAAISAASLLLAARHLLRRAEVIDGPPSTLAALVVASVRDRARRLLRGARSVRQAIAPGTASWREIRWGGAADELLSFGSFAVTYTAVVALALVLALLEVTVVIGSGDSIGAVVFRAQIGYNALFAVSIFTIAALGVVSMAVALRRARVIGFPLRVVRRLQSLAAHVGYGSLAGVIGAALTPVTRLVLGGASSVEGGELSPSILLEMPATGAVVGYVSGLVAIVLQLASESTNLVYRHLLLPTAFVGVLVLLHTAGFTPELLYRQLVGTGVDLAGTGTGICDAERGDSRVAALLSDPPGALRAVEQCGGQNVLPGSAFVQVSAAIMMTFAAVGFTRGVRIRVAESSQGSSK